MKLRINKIINKHFRIILLTVLLIAFLGGCDGPKRRPIGYIALGKIDQFQEAEYYLPNFRILLRRDSRGLYAMSTQCALDLEALVREGRGDRYIFKAPNGSVYDQTGVVLNGPSKYNLPYYKLVLNSGEYGSRILDTLYVQVGVEVSPDWRLSLP